MDVLELLIGSKVKWTGDRIKTLAEVQPRHIGRVATFEYFENDIPEDYSSYSVTGRLDGVAGSEVFVSGEIYIWSRMADFKIYRSELA